ncbi:signal peptidase I [Oceanicoccus sp. KOV_DT_Chl]|uniref:signal peptidase I n=1 Tax=Oceanicoccus sp. KOV_DT_Chl TaxID=1904639 RepID=UPI001F413F32|nr:signal peptidase I [Oceanicoccus sp. KOV_DT_Chl]
MWLGWAAAVILVKDGDFAFVLVILTLLSGVITGLDNLLFRKGRNAFASSKALVEYLGKYTQEQRDSLESYLKQDLIVGEYARSFFPVLAIVLVLRSFIVEPFQIPSASMVPTLQVGDYILVNKFTYGLRLPVLGTKVVELGEPQRGDVMVFFPPHKDIYFIKRVIGLPGDQVTYKDKMLTVNGKPVTQTFLAELPPINPQVELFSENLLGAEHLAHKNKRVLRKDDFSITVKPGHYWMMGDNRDNSSDSRVWGQVPEQRIVGKAFAIWMHWPSFGQLPSFSRDGLIQ